MHMNKKVAFELISGKKIFTILSEPEQSQKKIVIMSHGFRGTSTGPARSFVNFTDLLTKHGFSTLRFDQPNCGNSDGEFLHVSFREWVNTITHFSNKYIEAGYQVALLGQSMGATASLIAASQVDLKLKIKCVLLWVPDPESDYDNHSNAIAEENGEKYHMSFWREAKEMNFFKCLDAYTSGIHLVYGKKDKYVSESLRSKIIQKVTDKNQQVMILKGQDHSPWEYDVSQDVFKEEIEFLQKQIQEK